MAHTGQRKQDAKTSMEGLKSRTMDWTMDRGQRTEDRALRMDVQEPMCTLHYKINELYCK